MSRFQSSMFSRRTFTVVPVTDNNPLDTLGLVISSNLRHSFVFSSQDVLDLVGFSVLSIGCSDQHVVGDVVEMSTVLEPRSGHGNMIGCGLSLALDQDWEADSILSIPWLEG